MLSGSTLGASSSAYYAQHPGLAATPTAGAGWLERGWLEHSGTIVLAGIDFDVDYASGWRGGGWVGAGSCAAWTDVGVWRWGVPAGCTHAS